MPYYRKNLLILSTTIFLTAVSWNQVMPFLPLFMKDMGLKHNLLGWVGIVFALQSAASIIAQPFWGKMGDKYGRKPMAIRAGLCLAGIYFAMSFCQTPLQLAVLRFLNGALTGFIPMSMALIATNTPQKHAARSIATAQTASAAGLIVGPAIGGLLAGLVGYRGSMQVSGAAVFISTLLVLWLVQERSRDEIVEPTSLFQDFSIALRSKVLSSVMLTVMLYGLFVAAISPILALHLSNMNGRETTVWLTGIVFSLPPIALVLTAHSWTRFGERMGYDRGIQIGLVGAGLCGLALALVHNLWLFSGIFFVAGIFLASLNPSTGALICTRVEAGFRGRAYGMQSSAAMLGSLVAPLAATRIGMVFGLSSVFAFVGISALAGSLAFFLLVNGKGE
jgi:DHA1 family multidrug resistance protein-like MFS transporter